MKTEIDLDFDVFSQALFVEPVSVQQEDCAELADAIGAIEASVSSVDEDLDFDVFGQAIFQDPVAAQVDECAGKADLIWVGGLQKCGRAQPYYRAHACRSARNVLRRPIKARAATSPIQFQPLYEAGAQAPPF